MYKINYTLTYNDKKQSGSLYMNGHDALAAAKAFQMFIKQEYPKRYKIPNPKIQTLSINEITSAQPTPDTKLNQEESILPVIPNRIITK